LNLRLIRRTSFGKNVQNDKEVVIKLESTEVDKLQLVLEYGFYKKLRNKNKKVYKKPIILANAGLGMH